MPLPPKQDPNVVDGWHIEKAKQRPGGGGATYIELKATKHTSHGDVTVQETLDDFGNELGKDKWGMFDDQVTNAQGKVIIDPKAEKEAGNAVLKKLGRKPTL
ncbi:MAG: hypothetical protein JO126_04570 [Alphaproteobacteria bacterium]|nr:hypothetical protein [Alphaproteobacteria bacterium]MBV8548711.1 hypothetical protein [Alphaproteobacteria bacterium]